MIMMKKIKIFSVHIGKERGESVKILNKRVADAAEELTKMVNDWIDEGRNKEFEGEISVEDIIIDTQSCAGYTAHFFLTAIVKYKS